MSDPNTTTLLPMTAAEKRSLAWLLYASGCGEIISGATIEDVTNLLSLQLRVLTRSAVDAR